MSEANDAYLVSDEDGEFRVLANIPNWTADSPWENIICEARDEPTASRLLRSLALESQNQALQEALREVVNTLGPEHFGGEIDGLVAEGNEALRVARNALSPTQETDPE